MGWQEVFGFLGGGVIALALIPQVYRLYKLKSAHEISLLFTSLFMVGGVFWLAYGTVLHSMPMVIFNAINTVLTLAMMFAKLRYGNS